MHASRKRFCLTRNWIYLFQNYLYVRNISKTLKGIEKNSICIRVHFVFLRESKVVIFRKKKKKRKIKKKKICIRVNNFAKSVNF